MVTAIVFLLVNLGTNIFLVHGIAGAGGLGFIGDPRWPLPLTPSLTLHEPQPLSGSPISTVVARTGQLVVCFVYCFLYRQLHAPTLAVDRFSRRAFSGKA